MTDPSDNAYIEVLRPKSVPEGLIALGTITQVLDTHLKIQLTGGINCIVEQVYVPKNRCFKKGEQFVCKIVEKRPRKGYANAEDIIATLDPSSLQEDNLPKTLLSIPYVPLQCAVLSIEDHGYQMDIGFRNITGFLKFDETNEKKLIIGQIVRCCSKGSLKDDNRVIPLTMDKESMKRSEFSKEKVSQNTLTEKCVLPGSKSFLTVMNVLHNGLIVNFMNEFAGFVGINHLKEEWHLPKKNYKISDQLKCTALYYNSITRMFALSLVNKSKRSKAIKNFIENYHVGKIIKKCRVAYLDSPRAVYFKIDNVYKGVANVNDSLDKDVQTLTRDEIHSELDSTFPENSPHRCRIKSLNLADLVIVLSLRQEFLDLPCVSLEELKPNDKIEVVVKKHIDYGIIVTFGLNFRAMILNEDLRDFVTSSSHKKYPVGKKTSCRVLRVNLSKQPPRIYLTNKEDSDESRTKPLEENSKGANKKAETLKRARVEQIPEISTIKPSKRKTLKKSVVEDEQQVEFVDDTPDEKNEEQPTNENSTGKGMKRKRSEEARMREEKLRAVEIDLMDPKRPLQSIPDFERLILKSPDSAQSWIKYSSFFLNNIETEKARIICRRALKTINFRMEREKLKIWLHLIKIEAKYGGSSKLHEAIEEAAQTNDKLRLYQGAVKILVGCGMLAEAERLHDLMMKLFKKSTDVWIDYIQFCMEHQKDFKKARELFERAKKGMIKSDHVLLTSRYAQFEFKHGEAERGKTIFESLISDNPKRKDLQNVYAAMVRKYGANSPIE